MSRKWVFIAPLAILGMVAFIAIGGEIVMLLWNWLLPPIFGWHEISFWQAIGMLALCRILFGRFGGHGWSGSGMRGRMRDRMTDRMADRWGSMTPEERERFRQRIRERFGAGPFGDEPRGDETNRTV